MGLFGSIKKRADYEFNNPDSHLNRFYRKAFGSNTTTYERPKSTAPAYKPAPKTAKKQPYNPGGDFTGAGIVTKNKK